MISTHPIKALQDLAVDDAAHTFHVKFTLVCGFQYLF